MSRIGNKVITLTEGVTVDVQPNNFVVVKGPKGEISAKLDPRITIEVDGLHVKVKRPDDTQESKTIHGTTRANLHNMVEGVTKEFTKGLEVRGTGYRVSLNGKTLVVAAGYSHLVELPIPEGIKVEVPTQTEIVLRGVNKQVVGEFAAEIRAVRKPEPYLGKGIRYKGEVVRHKEGKKAK